MSHHRQHTVNFFLEASSEIHKAQLSFADYLSSASVPTTEKYVADRRYAPYYLALTVQAIGEAMIQLREPAEFLEFARRIINQPQNDNPRSAVQEISKALSHMISLQELPQAEPGATHDATLLADTTEAAQAAWVALDRAIWHINDAIREEVYMDLAFG